MFKRGRNRLVNFKIKFTKQASIDANYLKKSNLELKAKEIIEIIKTNPFSNPPPFEKLVGDLRGMYSRRINIQHRIVYSVDLENRIVKIVRMWKHYK
jgi:Txe/YoeB family toxin of toxin-antitoxin system